MKGAELYREACTEEDPGGYVSALSDHRLACLMDHIGNATSGIPALILGLCQEEAASRWLLDQKDRIGAVGEGGA